MKHPQIIGKSQDALVDLQPKQRTVMALLSEGRTISEVAATARVGRRTVHRWLREDPHFRAAYNRWRIELESSARSRLLTLADGAIATVQTAVASGDARLAMTLLKGLGLVQPPVHGPIDPTNAAIEQQKRTRPRVHRSPQSADRQRHRRHLRRDEHLVGNAKGRAEEGTGF